MKILVIGLDGATPELLLADERLENLRRLMDAGCHGPLESVVPPTSVPAWMCQATSLDPGSLGIYGPRDSLDHASASSSDPHVSRSGGNAGSTTASAIWDQVARQGGRAVVVGPDPIGLPQIGHRTNVDSFLTSQRGTAPFSPWTGSSGPLLQPAGLDALNLRNLQTPDPAGRADELLALSRQQFAAIRQLMQSQPWDYFQFVESGLDRIQRTFWRHHDPEHPRHEPGRPEREIVRNYYRHLDEEIGRVLELLSDETLVLVCSAHGACKLDGGFCVNEWLIREGLLVLHRYPDSVTPLAELDVDWDRTTAWCEGGCVARVFLNVKGREPRGTIPPADCSRVRDELKQRLEATIDPNGNRLGTVVFQPDSIYRQVRNRAPDLIVHCGGLSWRALDGVGYPSIHVIDHDAGLDDCNPSLFGAFVLAGSNLPIEGPLAGIQLLDLAPTLLELAGYDVPAEMQGRTLAQGSLALTSGASSLTPSEEELVRARLRGLGYIS